MIKINKDLENIPNSLTKPITQRKREELIANNGYINEDKYNNWYKKEDVKAALKAIYHHKCAFCEQKVEQFHVEHFRPKSIYYWLAFSWDNLLLACATCNTHKNNHFETLEERVQPNDIDFKEIHQLSAQYNLQEKNLFVHPELESIIEAKLTFDFQRGLIQSSDRKLNYTIDKCQLNREYLRNERAEIFNELMEKVTATQRLIQLGLRSKNSLTDIIQSFIDETKNPKKQFLAFKRGILKKIK